MNLGLHRRVDRARSAWLAKRRWLILVSLLAWSGAATTAQVRPGAAPPQPPFERAVSAQVSEPRLRDAVKALAALGPRTGGTASGNRAVELIAGRFRGVGLETEVRDDPAWPTYVHDAWRVDLSSGQRLASAFPFGFSGARADASRVRLVFVADLRNGVTSEPLDGAAVYTRTPAEEAVSVLERDGVRPAVLLTSAPHLAGRYTDWAAIGALPARSAPAYPVFGLSLNDGTALETAARAGQQISATLQTTIAEGRPRTVVATLKGRDASRYWLVSAHGDSDAGGPGADDNASGVAVVMETARVLAGLRASGHIPELPVSVRFVVWGAEYHSSRAYIEREGEALANCLGVINIDQAGTGAERESIYFESNDVPWNARLLRTFEAIGHDYRGTPGFWPEFATTPSQGGTDSYAFLPRSYFGEGRTHLQLPATTVYTAAWDEPRVLAQTPGWDVAGDPASREVHVDYSRVYHSAGDTPEATTEREPQNLVRTAKAVSIALVRLVYDAGVTAR